MDNLHIKVGIVGAGVIGGALERHLKNVDQVEVHVYDPQRQGTVLTPVLAADVVFICVPAPYSIRNGYNTGILEGVAHSLADAVGCIVLRSTVLPGTTRRLLGPNACFMPEFLTARYADQDMAQPAAIMVGCDCITRPPALLKLLHRAWSVMPHWLTTEDAELVKVAANSFYSTKVNHFNWVAEQAQNYKAVRQALLALGWIHTMHTQVPGHDGQAGFGGTCLPKDTEALAVWWWNNRALHGVAQDNAIRRPDVKATPKTIIVTRAGFPRSIDFIATVRSVNAQRYRPLVWCITYAEPEHSVDIRYVLRRMLDPDIRPLLVRVQKSSQAYGHNNYLNHARDAIMADITLHDCDWVVLLDDDDILSGQLDEVLPRASEPQILIVREMYNNDLLPPTDLWNRRLLYPCQFNHANLIFRRHVLAHAQWVPPNMADFRMMAGLCQWTFGCGDTPDQTPIPYSHQWVDYVLQTVKQPQLGCRPGDRLLFTPTDWSLSGPLCTWIVMHVPHGSVVVELGAGLGTEELRRWYQVMSVEQNPEYCQAPETLYCPLEPKQDPLNPPHMINWYREALLMRLWRCLPVVDVLLVDGPTQTGRSGVWPWVKRLGVGSWVIVDDTHREEEALLARRLVQDGFCHPVATVDDDAHVRQSMVLQRV